MAETETTDGEGGQKPTTEPTVHTHIGNRDGVIVECLPTDRDRPQERDMSHLTPDAAEELRDQLSEYLEELDRDSHDIECMYSNQLATQFRCTDCGERADEKSNFSDQCPGDQEGTHGV